MRARLSTYKKDDTGKVSLYIALANAHRYSGPDSVKWYAGKAFEISNALKFSRGKAGSSVAFTLAELLSGNFDSAIGRANQAVSYYKELGDSPSMATPFYYIGAAYYNTARFNDAIKYYRKTAEVLRNSNDLELLSGAYDNLGVTYSTIGIFSESLKYYLKGLDIREKNKNEAAMISSLGNIGRVYASLGNTSKALEFTEKSLSRIENLPKDLKISTYENAGTVFMTVKDTSKAITVLEKALSLVDGNSLPSEINRIMANTAEAYLQKGNFAKAQELYSKCQANSPETNSPAVNALILRGISRVHAHDGNYRQAISEMKSAMGIFLSNEMIDHYAICLRDLAGMYASVRDYELAYRTMAEFTRWNDSVITEESARKAANLQYDFDIQRKEDKIRMLMKDESIMRTRSEKQTILNIALILGLISLLATVAVILRSKKRLQESKLVITKQAQELSDLNNYKDKILSILSHDLRGPLGSIQSSLSLFDEKAISPDQFSEITKMLQQQMASVNTLLDNLLKWSMANMAGKSAIHTEDVNLSAIVKQNVSLLQASADEKNIKLKLNFPETLNAKADYGNVDIIIRNLISNAVKFTQYDGEIKIEGKTDGKNTTLSIIDNGIGMNEEKLRNLFSVSPSKSTSGTNGERGIGLGLLICHQFAVANRGEIRVESEIDKGSTFTLVLPA
ncbi:MAG: tetratricopeptide repeat protein [Flavipsychrobacter sp.]|nr:tetratricopeptide repeat protein [Flavipsychrobacter sp.]